MQVSSLYLLA